MNWKFGKTRRGGEGGSPPERSNQSLSDLHRRKNFRRRIFWSIIAGLFLATIICLFFRWLIWSPWWQVKKIDYTGLDRVSQAEVENYLKAEIAGGKWWQRALGYEHILSWPAQAVWAKPIYLPVISEISAKRDLSTRSLRVKVLELKPMGIWCSLEDETDKCAWFAGNGLVIEKAPLAEGSLIPVVRDVSGKSFRLGGPVLESPDKMTSLLSIFKVLSDEQIAVREVRLEQSLANEIKVVQADGPEMYFSLRFPADMTQGPIHALREKGWTNLTYLDFRIENRVYYK